MQYRIVSVIKETENASSFVLEPLRETVSYEAGQFITFIFRNRNAEEERRSYSISSASVLNEPLMVTVKRVANGTYSRMLIDKAVMGDILTGLSPTGFFTLPPASGPNKRFVFFAAGSGITPVYALIKTLLATSDDLTIILVYSNRSVNDTLFYQPLQALAEKYADTFHVHFLFSDAPRYSDARLSALMAEEIMQKYFQGALSDTLVYICGPFQYMLMITLVLRGMGIKDNQIKKEQFTVHKSKAPQKPVDIDLHVVHATLGESAYSWKVQYPDTILQAAKKQRINLPYNCESGQCGACAAICVKSKVWMYKMKC